MFLALQITTLIAVAGYLAHNRIRLARRNGQSWESLERPAIERSLSLARRDHRLPEELWTNIDGPHGIWAIFKNAGVLMEMADFADRNSRTVDPILLQRLRSDALQIRQCALIVLIQWIAHRGSEQVRIKAFLAASMYTGMTARMVHLMEQSAGEVLPGFVAAM